MQDYYSIFLIESQPIGRKEKTEDVELMGFRVGNKTENECSEFLAKVRLKRPQEKKKHHVCGAFLWSGEANAPVSELPSIARSSSLVGTVTGSFLKLNVIPRLSS